jgi:large subunit ribosomal protein L35Ae
MKARIVNYRGGKSTQVPNQILIEIAGCDSRAVASKFIGKRVVWKSPAKKEINGKITQTHGNNGILRARFSKGLPGQALGGKVDVLE